MVVTVTDVIVAVIVGVAPAADPPAIAAAHAAKAIVATAIAVAVIVANRAVMTHHVPLNRPATPSHCAPTPSHRAPTAKHRAAMLRYRATPKCHATANNPALAPKGSVANARVARDAADDGGVVVQIAIATVVTGRTKTVI